MNVFRIAGAIAISFFIFNDLYGQQEDVFVIRGKISGIKDGSTVRLKTETGRFQQIAVVSNGRFSFKSRNLLPGILYALHIDSIVKSNFFLVDSNEIVDINVDMRSWPEITVDGGKDNEVYQDFYRKIQAPYSKAHKKYTSYMEKLSGFKSYSEWEDFINHYRGKDSCDLLYARLEHKLASTLYNKETLLWIIRHPDSIFTCELILRWWPKEDMETMYYRLPPKSRNSYPGQKLKEAIGRQHNN